MLLRLPFVALAIRHFPVLFLAFRFGIADIFIIQQFATLTFTFIYKVAQK